MNDIRREIDLNQAVQSRLRIRIARQAPVSSRHQSSGSAQLEPQLRACVSLTSNGKSVGAILKKPIDSPTKSASPLHCFRKWIGRPFLTGTSMGSSSSVENSRSSSSAVRLADLIEQVEHAGWVEDVGVHQQHRLGAVFDFWKRGFRTGARYPRESVDSRS